LGLQGTTEYALDALLAAPHQASRLGLPTSNAYICPVDPDVCLPMVFVDDLMRGLIALQEADADQLIEYGNCCFIFGPFLAHFSAPFHPARAVCCALLGVHADRVLIGAWNVRCPMS